MAEGGFYTAASPAEACALLARHGDGARLLAGGTDLMVAVNERRFAPQVLIYLGACGLNYIRVEGGKLLIGAATPFAEILKSDLVRDQAPLLAEAVAHLASPAIRNAGTVGGNLANASPAADSATALLALGASLKLTSPAGQRVAALEDFFTGPGQSVLKAGELIEEVIVPAQAQGAGWAYRKLGKRKAQSLSVVSVAVYCPLADGKCRGARLALGAVAPTPLLARKAAALLEGQKLEAGLIDRAAKAAAEETRPIDDVRGSAWYRRRAAEGLVRQLLGQIAGQ